MKNTWSRFVWALRPLLLLLVLLLLLPTQASEVATESTTATKTATKAASVLRDLGAANQARQDQAAATAAWQAEQQRLKLLITESRRQQQALSQQISSDEKAIVDKQSSLKNYDSLAEQSAAMDAALVELSQQCHEELNKRALHMPGGSIAAPGVEATDPGMQFLRASARLQQSLSNSGQWRVSLSEGELNGKTVVYDKLTMGNACAWWLSRDGQRAGMLKRQHGKNILIEINNDSERAAIQKAIAIMHGDQAPELMQLPVVAEAVVSAEQNKSEVNNTKNTKNSIK